jgi:hypothetical protein
MVIRSKKYIPVPLIKLRRPKMQHLMLIQNPFKSFTEKKYIGQTFDNVAEAAYSSIQIATDRC